MAHLTDPSALERWFETLARTVAIDFDGVLHPYTAGWCGSAPADEAPISGALEFLQHLNDLGYRCVVFSTRADHSEGHNGIMRWLHEHGLLPLIDSITHLKPAAVAYVDDRAVAFTGDNWGTCLDRIERLAQGASHGAGAA